MGGTGLINLTDKLHRRFSDDYDQTEPSLRGDQDFSVKIGDVTFVAKHGGYRRYGFTVRVGNIDVAYVSENADPYYVEWVHESPALGKHIACAVVEFEARLRAYQQAQNRRAERERQTKVDEMKAFKTRFGIVEEV